MFIFVSQRKDISHILGSLQKRLYACLCCSVDPNFKYNVHCTGVEYGTTEDWNVAWERAQITTNSLGKESHPKKFTFLVDMSAKLRPLAPPHLTDIMNKNVIFLFTNMNIFINFQA